MTVIVSKYGYGAPTADDLETGELGLDIRDHAIYTLDGNKAVIKLADGKAAASVQWNDVLNKPTEFPPENHTHDQSEIDGLTNTINNINLEITNLGDEIAAIATTLAFGGSFDASNGNIVKGAKDGFVAGQAIPAASAHENTFIICSNAGTYGGTDMQEGDWLVSNGVAWVPITYSSGSAGSVDWNNVQGKPDFDALYAPISHDHEISDVNGLQDALNAKPDADHTHEIANVNGLQAALDSKANLDRITGGTY